MLQVRVLQPESIKSGPQLKHAKALIKLQEIQEIISSQARSSFIACLNFSKFSGNKPEPKLFTTFLPTDNFSSH